jgi:hypothetical protein
MSKAERNPLVEQNGLDKAMEMGKDILHYDDIKSAFNATRRVVKENTYDEIKSVFDATRRVVKENVFDKFPVK